MGKNSLIFGSLGLIFGLIIGFTGANYLNREVISVNSNLPQNQIPNPNPNQQQPPISQTGIPQQTGMLPDVQKVIDQAVAEPENYEAQIKAGEMYARIRNFEKALEFYQKAQQIKPDEFESNASLGNAFFDARQFENAETYYAKALEIKPDDINVITDLGTTYVERRQPNFDKAISQFEKVLKIKPEYDLAIYNLGIAYLRNGNKDKAQESLNLLRTTNPNSDLVERFQKVINK